MERPSRHPISDRQSGSRRRSRPRHPWQRVLGAALLCLGLLGAWGAPAAAQFSSPLTGATGRGNILEADGRPWSLKAEEVRYDHQNEIYEAHGNVRIFSGDRSLEAQHARLEVRTQQVDLTGAVVIRYGRDWLKGEHVIWHLDTETGWVDGGTAYFSDSGFYLSARELRKTGAKIFLIQDGQVTSCDPGSPDWSIRYRDAKIDMDGIGTAKHSRFYVGEVPILYFPWLAFPANRDRQSGLLPPSTAVSGLNGFEYEQPYFWAIRQDMDLTFSARYLAKRGVMGGAEYRINHATLGEGRWLFHYLDDQAGEQYLADEGYPFQQTGRYWVRGRHDFQLPYQIKGTLDVDLLSDRNFLKEFEDGSASYNYTNHLFRSFSNRDILNDDTITTRENNLYLRRATEDTLTGMDTRYYDNLDRSQDETTLQQLPLVFFDVSPVWFEQVPMYYSLQSSAVNYTRREGDAAFRADLSPRFYYPLHVSNYLDLEPSVGVQATGYQVDWQTADKDAQQSRFLSDLRLDLSSRLNRVFDVKFWDYAAFQHAFRPELVYRYVPEVDQDDLPQFDEFDWISKENSIRYGFSTFLTGKKLSALDGQPTTMYHEMARLQVYQTYQLESTVWHVSNEDFSEIPDDSEHRLSDLNMKLDLTPGRYLTLSYDVGVSPYQDTLSSQNLSMLLNSTGGHWVQVNYRYLDNTEVDELITRFRVQLRSNIYFDVYHDYSFDKQELFRQAYGLTYTKGCWGLQLAYREQGEKQWVTLAFNLRGLGHIGGDMWY